MNPLLITVIVLLVVSGIGLIVFILLHSGKGTGISDMIASSVYSTQTGTSIVEKNLDRITVVLAVVFLVSLLALMIIYPKGTPLNKQQQGQASTQQEQQAQPAQEAQEQTSNQASDQEQAPEQEQSSNQTSEEQPQ